jgi:hypothetical protein
MQNELINVLEKVENAKLRQNRDGNILMLSPIFLSSFSLYSHLTGNIDDAIRL